VHLAKLVCRIWHPAAHVSSKRIMSVKQVKDMARCRHVYLSQHQHSQVYKECMCLRYSNDIPWLIQKMAPMRSFGTASSISLASSLAFQLDCSCIQLVVSCPQASRPTGFFFAALVGFHALSWLDMSFSCLISCCALLGASKLQAITRTCCLSRLVSCKAIANMSLECLGCDLRGLLL